MIEYKDLREYEDGSSFTFIYSGEDTNNKYDNESTSLLIRKFAESCELHKNLLRNVMILRTIFKDLDERNLYVKYTDKKKSEYVDYVNGDLTFFERKEKNTKNKASYTIGKSINIDFDPNDKDPNGLRELSRDFYDLKFAKPIEITDKDKELVQMYKLFFNRDPRFFNINTNLRYQSMMFLLKEFGIDIVDYNFKMNNDLKMPYSKTLERDIYNLFPFDDFGDVSKYTNETNTKKITIIANDIKETLRYKMDFDKALINLSNIIYVKKYDNNGKLKTKDIAEKVELPKEEVRDNKTLIKIIKKSLKSE